MKLAILSLTHGTKPPEMNSQVGKKKKKKETVCRYAWYFKTRDFTFQIYADGNDDGYDLPHNGDGNHNIYIDMHNIYLDRINLLWGTMTCNCLLGNLPSRL